MNNYLESSFEFSFSFKKFLTAVRHDPNESRYTNISPRLFNWILFDLKTIENQSTNQTCMRTMTLEITESWYS